MTGPGHPAVPKRTPLLRVPVYAILYRTGPSEERKENGLGYAEQLSQKCQLLHVLFRKLINQTAAW